MQASEEDFRTWAADFDEWPERWMGTDDDLAYGRRLLPLFAGFLQALFEAGMARRTFRTYRDDAWLLGGSIIRQVFMFKEHGDDPREKLVEAVCGGGMLPDHYDEMSDAELRGFGRMCRRFEKHLMCTCGAS